MTATRAPRSTSRDRQGYTPEQLADRHRAGYHQKSGSGRCPLCIERKATRSGSLSRDVAVRGSDLLPVACDCGRGLRLFTPQAVRDLDCSWLCDHRDCGVRRVPPA